MSIDSKSRVREQESLPSKVDVSYSAVYRKVTKIMLEGADIMSQQVSTLAKRENSGITLHVQLAACDKMFRELKVIRTIVRQDFKDYLDHLKQPNKTYQDFLTLQEKEKTFDMVSDCISRVLEMEDHLIKLQNPVNVNELLDEFKLERKEIAEKFQKLEKISNKTRQTYLEMQDCYGSMIVVDKLIDELQGKITSGEVQSDSTAYEYSSELDFGKIIVKAEEDFRRKYHFAEREPFIQNISPSLRSNHFTVRDYFEADDLTDPCLLHVRNKHTTSRNNFRRFSSKIDAAEGKTEAHIYQALHKCYFTAEDVDDRQKIEKLSVSKRQEKEITSLKEMVDDLKRMNEEVANFIKTHDQQFKKEKEEFESSMLAAQKDATVSESLSFQDSLLEE